MKRIHTLKRTIALFLAMLMAATSTAFANWDSFQGNNDNNGTSTYGVTSLSGKQDAVTLPNDGATTGLDVEPLVHGDRIYAFHNGGKNGPTVTAISATDGSRLWTMPVSSGMVTGQDYIENVSQVSTPVIDKDGKNLYGVYTYNFDGIYGAQTDFHPVNIGVKGSETSTATASYTSVTIPGDYSNLQLDTGLSNAAYDATKPSDVLTGTATLKNRETHAEFTFSGKSFENQNFSLYYSGGVIPAGSYDLEVTITNNTSLEVIWRRNRLYAASWKMFGLSGIEGGTPALITGINLSGRGQAASPLTLSGNNVYFGIYDADKAYYQYGISKNTSSAFTPGDGNGFYNAGAAIVGTNVIFGSDSGKVYMRPDDNFSGGNPDGRQGEMIDLNTYQSNPGKVRSSVCYDATDSALYLTSYNGFLWRIRLSGSSFGTVTPMNITHNGAMYSVSTPVVSPSGMIYVGTFGYTSDPNGVGYIMATRRDTTEVNAVCSSSIIQSSPVVYYNGTSNSDYIYFTTNVKNGTGYCYRCLTTTTTGQPLKVWSVTPESGKNGYAVQGFAMGTYTIRRNTYNFGVFGNDSNQLVICRMLVPASAR